MIDYALAKRRYPRQKAALTRAMNTWKANPSAFNQDYVVRTIEKAVVEWSEWGAWPDGWHRWNVAYQDVTGDYRDISEVF